MATVALYNVKGGVGKTATCVNLAALSAASGLRTLVWDLDPQAASTWYFGHEASTTSTKPLLKGRAGLDRIVTASPYENLDLIPASTSYRMFDIMLERVDAKKAALKRLLAPFSRRYDMIFLDAPPSLSKLADNIFTAADRVVVPIIPTWLSLRAYEQLTQHFKTKGFDAGRLRPFFSMADRRRKSHRDLLDSPPPQLKHRCRAVIPYASLIERMGESRAPLTVFAPPSHPAVAAYADLWACVRRGLAPLST